MWPRARALPLAPALALALALAAAAEGAAGGGGGREVVKFDFAWRFALGPTAYNPSHLPALPTNSTPAEATEAFDDSTWAIVDAPHDFLIGQCESVRRAYPLFASLPPALRLAPRSRADGWTHGAWPTVALRAGLKYNASGDATEGARLPRGDGWYRKHFALPAEWRGRAVRCCRVVGHHQTLLGTTAPGAQRRVGTPFLPGRAAALG